MASAIELEARDAADPAAEPARLAAIVFDRDEEPDPPLAEFCAALALRGVRVAGLLQEHGCDDGTCDLHDVRVRDLVTGATLPIMQDLGRDATGCRVDQAAIAVAARMLDAARETAPDLIVVNRFGRLESEGQGMLAEIGRACADGLPLIVCVPKRYLSAWDAFAAGLDARLPPEREAIEAWWRALAPAARGASAA